ncbi:hypothetical protein [Candidatus Albibeggiatoa sp. nov. BB20]|uniref:hypothetical protein n=1 Tax=Candidatus Albibeggiatoa sp. nov. BB20 TaxID=3162723 RepID=UPI0033655526
MAVWNPVALTLEQSRMRHPERLSKLFAILSITFAWYYRVGEWRNKIKSIRKLKHKRPAYPLFRYGLYFIASLFLTSSSLHQHSKPLPKLSEISFYYEL